jgi:hypothetical protein
MAGQSAPEHTSPLHHLGRFFGLLPIKSTLHQCFTSLPYVTKIDPVHFDKKIKMVAESKMAAKTFFFFQFKMF